MTKLSEMPRRASLYLGGGLLLAGYASIFADTYDLRVLTLAGIFAILAIGYQFIFGHAGALSLAQGAFFGLGAYGVAILSTSTAWPMWLVIPSAIALPVLVAAIVAVPVLRLDTHYFALATLGVAEVLRLVVVNWQELTGGANGIAGIPPLAFGGISLSRGLGGAILVWVLVAICGAVAWRTMRGRMGHRLTLLRGDYLAARASGIDGGRVRLKMFLASAACGGLAGALYAPVTGVVAPQVMDLSMLVTCLAIVVIGGPRRVAGAVIGALLLVHLPEWLRDFEQYYLIVYGAAMLAMVILAPEGLVGWFVGESVSAMTRPDVPVATPDAVHVATGTSVLQTENLTKRFGGVIAVDEVSLSARAGEIVGLIGPNGSGKTTFLNLVGGLVASDSGRVRLLDRDLTRLAADARARAGIGRSFQTPKLAGGQRAVDIVCAATRDEERTPDTFFAVAGKTAIKDAPFATLPAADRRWVDLLRADATARYLLLLDEPAAGLSSAERDRLAAWVRDHAESGLAVLIVEHNMRFLLDLADRIVCLDRGRVIADGPPDLVRNDPRVIDAYLGRESGEEGT